MKKTEQKKRPNILSFVIIIFAFIASVIISLQKSPTKKVFAAVFNGHKETQQQGTFVLTTPTPTIISTPTPTPWYIPHVNPAAAVIIPAPLPTGGAALPTDPFYCIDNEDPIGCSDNTAFHIPKAMGGPTGPCGTIMENAHKIVAFLPQVLTGMRDRLNPAVTNSCHNTGKYSSGYISTFFVIDAFNLTGFKELSKTYTSHVSGKGMLNWWKSQPPGYVFLPYTATILQQHAAGTRDLTGCVVFLNLPSGNVHVGIFNVLQLVNGNGDGVLSILQSGSKFYIDRFPVAGWDIKNTPLNDTVISGVAGFGCHT